MRTNILVHDAAYTRYIYTLSYFKCIWINPSSGHEPSDKLCPEKRPSNKQRKKVLNLIRRVVVWLYFFFHPIRSYFIAAKPLPNRIMKKNYIGHCHCTFFYCWLVWHQGYFYRDKCSTPMLLIKFIEMKQCFSVVFYTFDCRMIGFRLPIVGLERQRKYTISLANIECTIQNVNI